MLVEPAVIVEASLVPAEDAPEKARLAQQSLRAAIVVSRVVESCRQDALEIVDRPLLSPHEIVERDDFAEQRRPEVERRDVAFGDRFVGRSLDGHFALERRQQPRAEAGEDMKPFVPVAAREEIREHECAGLVDAAILECTPEQIRRRPRGHEDSRGSGGGEVVDRNESREDGAECRQRGRAMKSRAAFGDHYPPGGAIALSMSCFARSSSISEPAAADDACQAWSIAPDATADLLVSTACSASRAALSINVWTDARSDGGTMERERRQHQRDALQQARQAASSRGRPAA